MGFYWAWVHGIGSWWTTLLRFMNRTLSPWWTRSILLFSLLAHCASSAPHPPFFSSVSIGRWHGARRRRARLIGGSSGARVQLAWAKSSPRLDEHDGEVRVTVRASQSTGHSNGSSATARRRRSVYAAAGSRLGGVRELPVAPVGVAGRLKGR